MVHGIHLVEFEEEKRFGTFFLLQVELTLGCMHSFCSACRWIHSVLNPCKEGPHDTEKPIILTIFSLWMQLREAVLHLGLEVEEITEEEEVF